MNQVDALTQIVERALGLFESGRLSRREAAKVALGAAGALLGPTASAQARSTNETPAEDEPVFRATELNHVALRATDVARSEAFYRDTLGLETLRESRTTRFMACGPHFVALFQGREPGLDHLAFSWPGYSQDEAVRRLEQTGIEARTRGNRTYFDDPDGLELQVAWNEDWPGSGSRPGSR